MSVKMSSAVWSDASISDPGLLLTMLAMADFADDDGRCWPAVDTLARKLRVTDRTVQNRIRTLEQAGKITILTRCGRCNTNRYVITPSESKHPEMVKRDAEMVKQASPFTKEMVKPGALKGEKQTLNGETAISPDPSVDPSVQPSCTGTKGGTTDQSGGDLLLQVDVLEPDPLAVPQDMCTPEVLDAWDDWLQHRKELKKPVTPVAAKLQFKELRAWGPQRWVKALNYSMRHGYRGCFEERVYPRATVSATAPISAQNCQPAIEAKVLHFGQQPATT